MTELEPNYDDPIVKELHEIRHAMLAEYGGDIDAMMKAVFSMRVPGVKYVETPLNANRIRPVHFRHIGTQAEAPAAASVALV